MSDLVTTLKETHKYPENQANDITSAIYTFANYMGESLGPLYGGFFTYSYNFEFSCVLTGLLNFAFLLLFVYMNKSFIFREKIKLEEEEENADVTAIGFCTSSIYNDDCKNYNSFKDDEKGLFFEENENGNENGYVQETVSLSSDLKEKLI